MSLNLYLWFNLFLQISDWGIDWLGRFNSNLEEVFFGSGPWVTTVGLTHFRNRLRRIKRRHCVFVVNNYLALIFYTIYLQCFMSQRIMCNYNVIYILIVSCIQKKQWANLDYYSSDESYAMESGDESGNEDRFGVLEPHLPPLNLAPS